MTTQNELVTAEKLAVEKQQPQQGLSIEQAFRAVVDGTLDAARLDTMKQLLAMDAERKFAGAFVALQSEIPVIVAKTVIPNRGKYEKFEDLMTVVGPLLTKHGFTVSFSQAFDDKGRSIETCTLSHAAGHSRPNSFGVRPGRADSDTQADCKAATTAKRNALCNALNIVIRQDCLNEEEDVTIEGDPGEFITREQADDFEHRAKLLNCDVPFLVFAKAKKFSEIQASRYDELEKMLSRKERSAK